MIVSTEELLKGKGTIIKNQEFLPTCEYVNPFFDRMSKFTDDFRIEVKLPDQITKLDELEDITYNRVWIQAVLPDEFAFENHQEVIGFLYGLDTKKPIVKIYRGALNMACTNLCVFNPSFLSTQDLEPGSPINYKPIINIMEQTNDIAVWLEKLSSTHLGRDKESIERELGRWVHNSMVKGYDGGYGKVKLASSAPVNAFKKLFVDTKSPYYVKEDEEPDMFKVYNAFTQIITDDTKDIMNKAEKTLLLKSILEL